MTRNICLKGDCAQVLADSDLVATLKVQLTEDDTLPRNHLQRFHPHQGSCLIE